MSGVGGGRRRLQCELFATRSGASLGDLADVQGVSYSKSQSMSGVIRDKWMGDHAAGQADECTFFKTLHVHQSPEKISAEEGRR